MCSVASDSFVILWIIACQTPLSMEFPRQEYWSGLPFPPLGDLSNPRIKPMSLALSCIGRQILYQEATWETLVKLKVTQICLILCDPLGLYSPWNSPGQNTGGGSHSLLQGIFPTQGSSPGLPHCRWLLNQLSHQGSPRILEWAAYPFSRGSSWPRTRTGVSCMVGGFFIS